MGTDKRDDKVELLLEEVARQMQANRTWFYRLRYGQAKKPGDDDESPDAWPDHILDEVSKAPTYIEQLVARACKDRSKSLTAVLEEMCAELEDLRGDGSLHMLSRLLETFYYYDKPPKVAQSCARAASFRFRTRRWRMCQVVSVEDPTRTPQFVEQQKDRLWRLDKDGQLRFLFTVDVLARGGGIVEHVLRELAKQIRGGDSQGFEALVARIVVQGHDASLEDWIESLQADTSLCEELAANHIFAWIRPSPTAASAIAPGTIFANWLSSVPYPVDERECADIRQRLWLGAPVAEMEVHDLYFGVHGGSEDGEDIYNYFALEHRSAPGIREWQKQLATLHGGFWRATIPHGRPPRAIEFSRLKH